MDVHKFSQILLLPTLVWAVSPSASLIQGCALLPGQILEITKVIDLSKLSKMAHNLEDMIQSMRKIQTSSQKGFQLHHNLISTILSQTVREFDETVRPICHLTESENLPLTNTIRDGMLENQMNKIVHSAARIRKTLFKYPEARKRARRDI